MSSSPFLSQIEFARHRGVSKAAVTKWKHQGLLVFSDEGLVNVDETEWNLDQRPAKYRGGVTHRPIKGPDRNNSDVVPKARTAKVEAKPRRAAPGSDFDDLLGGGGDVDSDSPNLPLAEAVRRKENFLGLQRKQDFEQKGRLLVDRAAAERVFFETARDLRDAWLSWPARVAVLMAMELQVDARTLTSVLTAHVHQHLSELGEPQADIARNS